MKFPHFPNEIELLSKANSCPFCGKTYHHFCFAEIPTADNDYYLAVYCTNCRAIGPQMEAVHLAVDMWNYRIAK